MAAELADAVGDHQRMVVRQRDDPDAETDVPGPLGGESKEDLGRPVDLEPADRCSLIYAS